MYELRTYGTLGVVRQTNERVNDVCCSPLNAVLLSVGH